MPDRPKMRISDKFGSAGWKSLRGTLSHDIGAIFKEHGADYQFSDKEIQDLAREQVRRYERQSIRNVKAMIETNKDSQQLVAEAKTLLDDLILNEVAVLKKDLEAYAIELADTIKNFARIERQIHGLKTKLNRAARAAKEPAAEQRLE